MQKSDLDLNQSGSTDSPPVVDNDTRIRINFDNHLCASLIPLSEKIQTAFVTEGEITEKMMLALSSEWSTLNFNNNDLREFIEVNRQSLNVKHSHEVIFQSWVNDLKQANLSQNRISDHARADLLNNALVTTGKPLEQLASIINKYCLREVPADHINDATISKKWSSLSRKGIAVSLFALCAIGIIVGLATHYNHEISHSIFEVVGNKEALNNTVVELPVASTSHSHASDPMAYVTNNSEDNKNSITVVSVQQSEPKVASEAHYLKVPVGDTSVDFVSIGSKQSELHFLLMSSEVSVSLYYQCVKANRCSLKEQPSERGAVAPALYDQTDIAVVNVSWFEITQQFIPWIKTHTNRQLRLPTEREWEYAAKQSKHTSLTTNCKDCNSLYRRFAQSVTAYPPNDIGVFGLFGNVQEWTTDCWSKATKPRVIALTRCDKAVVKGGSWFHLRSDLNVNYRDNLLKSSRSHITGFRLIEPLTVNEDIDD